ncbi:unnamed protein product [Microthlaspi erraticum]|uniref:Uncharacterized protein n=1 Tax=Microthlaspi erraticum TaxID=1685480 RepID=A0A6D2K310_9BRAS|nr:unnamed protein product [Microthlaspi erraticum]
MLDEAEAAYKNTLEIKHTRAHQGLARVYFLKNQRKVACEEMTKLIDNLSKQQPTRNGLSTVSVKKPKRILTWPQHSTLCEPIPTDTELPVSVSSWAFLPPVRDVKSTGME